MNKSIIVVRGRSGSGKSETIKNVCKILEEDYPNSIPSISPINYSNDIFVVFDLNGVKIGLESQGDPNSRIIYADSLKKLADRKVDDKHGGCDIIVCATRTGGMTVQKIYEIAKIYAYNLIWTSSYRTYTLNKKVLNKKSAESIVELIRSIIAGQL